VNNNKCLNCNSTDSSLFVKVTDIFGNKHTYVKCQSCKLVFMSPLPSEQIMQQVYNRDYYGEGEKEKFNNGLIVRVIDAFARKRAVRFAKYLNHGARIMDVGCGNGRFLEHLHGMKKNFDLNGIEIDAGAALRASNRLKAKAWIHTVTELEKFFGYNSFHAVSYIHVFEHLSDPAGTMNQLKNVVKPNGVVMIVVPNIESRQALKFKDKWLHLDPPRHLNFYPPQLLKEEMQKRGFELLSEKYQDIEQNPFGAIQSILNTMTKERDVLFERLKGNTSYAPKYGRCKVLLMKIFWMCMMPFCVIGDKVAARKGRSATVEMIFRKTEQTP
jgi:SAM-dependent methyltransferase